MSQGFRTKVLKFSTNVVTYMHIAQVKGTRHPDEVFFKLSLENLNPQLENYYKGHSGVIWFLVILYT